MRLEDLPAWKIAGEVDNVLTGSSCLVVTAPPGAGKSTVLPLTISLGFRTAADCQSGTARKHRKVLMLEPRRLAARQVAERMASILGEPVGKTVGYRVRFESKVSDATSIEVITEGILVRMLIEDPTLDGVDVLIFDEFHERSLVSDESLALARECQSIVRQDLKIVIMSATIDTESICTALNAVPVHCEGRNYPVEIIYAGETDDLRQVAQQVANVIRTAHKDRSGDILAFLPGESDIRRCQEILEGTLGSTRIYPLYGMLPFRQQQQAVMPGRPGERKVVLSTPVAETSLTIEGVTVVVDSGLYRKMVFDERTGLSHLETVRISMDMAVQRSGRAGRLCPGVCYRMWGKATESRMASCRVPEIAEADLASLVLDIAAWGSADVTTLPWLSAPDPSKIAKARRLLYMLGAVDDSGKLTGRGRAMASLPCHPRISNMLLESGDKSLASDIAALLDEKDPMSSMSCDSDLTSRIRMLRQMRNSGTRTGAWGRIMQGSAQFASLVGAESDGTAPDPFAVGSLLARAYPERVAMLRRDGCGEYLLAGGSVAELEPDDVLCSYGWIVAASLNDSPHSSGRIFLGAPVDPSDLDWLIRERDNVCWDPRRGGVVAQHEWNIGCLNLRSAQIHGGVRDEIVKVICEAARKDGTAMLGFSDEVGNLQRRVNAVAAWHPELGLPSFDTASVLSRAPEWLAPFVGTATTVAELKKIDLCQALWSMLTYEQQTAVGKIAPTHIEVPTGSRINLEYRLGADAPVLRVRLQECFGLLRTPCVDCGTRPVLMELLSPGFKPVQLTTDLESFWKDTYFEVRKELRRRYPKHSWPDNPTEAPAVRGVARKPAEK